MRIAVLSSTPLNPLEGSGTFVGIAGIARGLEAQGHRIQMRPLRWRTRFHTLDRWLYNLGIALSPPRDVDLVMGVDLDGFLKVVKSIDSFWLSVVRLPSVRCA